MIAAIIIAALLMEGQGGPPEPLPSASCLAIARAAVIHFQPATDAVAGRHVQVDVLAGTVSLPTALVSGKQIVFAEVNLFGSIVIHPAFCDLELRDQVVVMTHEIGHVVDRNDNPVRFFAQLSYALALPWEQRPTEQRANAYGRQILNFETDRKND